MSIFKNIWHPVVIRKLTKIWITLLEFSSKISITSVLFNKNCFSWYANIIDFKYAASKFRNERVFWLQICFSLRNHRPADCPNFPLVQWKNLLEARLGKRKASSALLLTMLLKQRFGLFRRQPRISSIRRVMGVSCVFHKTTGWVKRFFVNANYSIN